MQWRRPLPHPSVESALGLEGPRSPRPLPTLRTPPRPPGTRSGAGKGLPWLTHFEHLWTTLTIFLQFVNIFHLCNMNKLHAGYIFKIWNLVHDWIHQCVQVPTSDRTELLGCWGVPLNSAWIVLLVTLMGFRAHAQDPTILMRAAFMQGKSEAIHSSSFYDSETSESLCLSWGIRSLDLSPSLLCSLGTSTKMALGAPRSKAPIPKMPLPAPKSTTA